MEIEGRTDVDLSTVNRLEKEQTQPSVSTVVRICEGLEVTYENLALALRGEQATGRSGRDTNVPMGKNCLTPDDVKAFLGYSREHIEEGRDIVARWLTAASVYRAQARDKEYRDKARPFPSVTDFETNRAFVTVLYDEFALTQFVIPYPPVGLIDGSVIREIHYQGGALMQKDLERYISEMSRELPRAERSDHRLDNILSRLKMDSWERCRFADIMWLDERLGGDNELLRMFWSLSKFSDEFDDNVKRSWESKLLTALMMLSRWLEGISWDDTSWLNNLRNEIYTKDYSVR